MNVQIVIIVITTIYCISFIIDALVQVYYKRNSLYRKYKKQQHKIERLESECKVIQDEIKRSVH